MPESPFLLDRVEISGRQRGGVLPLAALLCSDRCITGTIIIKYHIPILEFRLVRKGFRGAWLEFPKDKSLVMCYAKVALSLWIDASTPVFPVDRKVLVPGNHMGPLTYNSALLLTQTGLLTSSSACCVSTVSVLLIWRDS